MKYVTQLKVDLAYNNFEQVNAFYKAIQNLNENSEFEIEIMDDGNGPYTEDMTAQYGSIT